MNPRVIPPSSSFCVLPWIHLFADEQGAMHPCCRSVGSNSPNVDDEGNTHYVHGTADWNKAWNSSYMKQLRLDMLSGERPKPCERCYMYDDLGIRSHRQHVNEGYGDRIPHLLASTSPKGEAPLNLASIDMRLGNLCNLRCRMCSPQASKGLIKEWAAFHKVPVTHKGFDYLNRLDWFSHDDFWKVFIKHTDQVERLHFAGGEPFLIPQMFTFLEKLISLGRASKIKLSYNTNLTTIPERLYDLWPAFKAVRVTVSLDGIREVNEFIRYPSKWETMDRNLKTFDEHAERLNCTGGLGINSTVQVYNVFSIHQLIDYVGHELNHFEAPNLSILRYPGRYSIQILPKAEKETAKKRLETYLEGFSGRWNKRWDSGQLESVEEGINGVIRHMMEEDQPGHLNDFMNWNGHQDAFRQQDARAVIPELANLFKEPSHED